VGHASGSGQPPPGILESGGGGIKEGSIGFDTLFDRIQFLGLLFQREHCGERVGAQCLQRVTDLIEGGLTGTMLFDRRHHGAAVGDCLVQAGMAFPQGGQFAFVLRLGLLQGAVLIFDQRQLVAGEPEFVAGSFQQPAGSDQVASLEIGERVFEFLFDRSHPSFRALDTVANAVLAANRLAGSRAEGQHRRIVFLDQFF